MSPGDAVSAREVAAVVATGAGHLVVAAWLQKQALFIIGAAVFWIGFVLLRLRRDRGALRAWGFGAAGFVQSARILLPIAAAAALGMLGYAVARGRPAFSWRLLLLLAVYPLWGLVQQFLVVALLAGNLRRRTALPAWTIVLATAALFAAIHAPSLPLVIVAGLMAAVTTTVYFRAGNLCALGLFHGWIASLSYFYVLGEDPLARLALGGLWP